MVKRISLAIVVLVLFQIQARSADLFCAAGNVGCLVAAIQISNANGEDNTIFLEPGTYTVRTLDNDTEGFNGLPVITGKLSIRGPEDQGSVIEAGQGFRLFYVAAGAILSLEWLAVRNGRISNNFYGEEGSRGPLGGGAILNRGSLNLNRVSMYNNSVLMGLGGGAIYSSGVLVIRNSSLVSNGGGGTPGGGVMAEGVINIEDTLFYKNEAGDNNGGALFLSNSVTTILRSTFSTNHGSDGPIANFGHSMLIESSSIHHNWGDGFVGGIDSGGNLTVISSTISDNRGSAIRSGGNLSLTNVTVARNITFFGATVLTAGGTARIQNSIIAMNYPSGGQLQPPDCNRFTSLGNNIIGNLGGCAVQLRSSDRVGDPALSAFSEDVDVMGSGHYPLLPESPAIDSASNGACTAVDQIGTHRDGRCDIGAVEFWDSGRVTAGSILNLIRP